MTDLMRYASMLSGENSRSLPPVDQWNPEDCGEIDIVIRRDGLWVHEGSPIGRAPLVRLFSTVLKREGDRFYLVTPVEKMQIVVEDAPFVAVAMRIEEGAHGRRLIFKTNVGDEVIAGEGHEIEYRPSPVTGEKTPYIHVRRGLWALIARAVFYDLVELGETRDIGGEPMFGVPSDGRFFVFGPASEVFVEG